MRTAVIVTLLGLTTIGAGVASAREYEISYGLNVQFMHSPSIDAVAVGDAQPLPEVGIGVGAIHLPLPFHPRLFLEARFSAGGTDAQVFQVYDGELDLALGQVGARAEFEVHRWIHLYARAAVGLLHGDLAFSTSSTGGTRIADSDWGATTYGALGAESAMLRAKPDAWDPDFALALRLEFGYLVASDLGFRAEPDYPDDGVARIDTFAAPLGDVNVSGPTFKFGIVGRF